MILRRALGREVIPGVKYTVLAGGHRSVLGPRGAACSHGSRPFPAPRAPGADARSRGQVQPTGRGRGAALRPPPAPPPPSSVIPSLPSLRASVPARRSAAMWRWRYVSGRQLHGFRHYKVRGSHGAAPGPGGRAGGGRSSPGRISAPQRSALGGWIPAAP